MLLDLVLVGNTALILGSFALFAVIHSLTAGSGVKKRLARWLGERWVEGWYRLLYNITSVLTLVPPLFFLVTLPDQLLYALSFPWSIVCLVFQVVGAGGILISLFSTDMWRFAGVAQVLEYLSGKPVVSSEVPLRLDGLYRLVRHPLYLFSLLVIWPAPVMTWNLLWFIIGATAYFAVGSMIEERRLEQQYGDAYRQYRRQVPWLFPWPRP